MTKDKPCTEMTRAELERYTQHLELENDSLRIGQDAVTKINKILEVMMNGYRSQMQDDFSQASRTDYQKALSEAREQIMEFEEQLGWVPVEVLKYIDHSFDPQRMRLRWKSSISLLNMRTFLRQVQSSLRIVQEDLNAARHRQKDYEVAVNRMASGLKKIAAFHEGETKRWLQRLVLPINPSMMAELHAGYMKAAESALNGSPPAVSTVDEILQPRRYSE